MIPIHFEILNASYCRVLKNPNHWDIIWNLLSYKATFRVGPKLRTTRISQFSKQNGCFGYGLLDYVKKELDKNQIPYVENYKSTPVELTVNPKISFNSITLEKYQEKAMDVLDKQIKRGIFEAGTGSGKTIYMASIIKKFNFPRTLIITPLTNIANQTVKSLEKNLNQKIGLIGDGSKQLENISVCLYQSLLNANLLALAPYIQMILIDEAHLACDAINKILSQFPNTWYRFGLTGTPIPKHKHKEWFTVTSQIGEIISKTTEKQAEERIINDIDAYMFYFYHDPVHNSYFDRYRIDVLRNKARCKLLTEMVKFGFDQGKKNCLLLVDEYEQAQLIEKLIKIFYKNHSQMKNPILAWSNSNVEKIKEDFIKGLIPFGIATPVFSVGTDIPNIEHICLGSARKSRSNLKQKIGRGRRQTEEKSNLLVTDIYDEIGRDDKFFKKYSESRMSFYKIKKWYKGLYKKIDGKWSLQP